MYFKNKQHANEQLRRISIDKFYEIVIGDTEAFKSMCEQLPITIDKEIEENRSLKFEKDTAIEELLSIGPNIMSALYKLAFSTYEGFDF